MGIPLQLRCGVAQQRHDGPGTNVVAPCGRISYRLRNLWNVQLYFPSMTSPSSPYGVALTRYCAVVQLLEFLFLFALILYVSS